MGDTEPEEIEQCRHKWDHGGNSGVDLCCLCPAGRFGDEILPNQQKSPPWGYETW